MIRTTREAPVFGLWRDGAVLEGLAKTDNLTTARYEPVTRNLLGTGYVDLLFESRDQSCVIGAIRLDPNSLVTRERSPFIWPAHVASIVGVERLVSIEGFLLPWLRSLARARPMATEAIRRFASSERFDRARAAELLGAAPLERVMQRMAPFVFARRFAAESRVFFDCADEALGHAVLDDLAASVASAVDAVTEGGNGDRAFARAWYGVRARESRTSVSDLVFADRSTVVRDRIVVVTSPWPHSVGVAIEVPSPAPQDLLFSFDSADAPVMSRFSVHAAEPPLRACARSGLPQVFAGSVGRIALALSAEARALRGVDVEEAQKLKRCLIEQGFSASIVTGINDEMMTGADLVHIFGAAYESHTIAFGQAALERGIDFVFDMAPRPEHPSAYLETMLLLALRAASDEAELARYLQAYEARRVTGVTAPEPSAEEYARIEHRFGELATSALAVLAPAEDVDGLRASLPAGAAGRVLARGVFTSAEPAPAPIGHLVPNGPFAFVHATIASRSHALFAAFAAERSGVPLVIAGPCDDVEYLQTLRTVAPQTLVLADPDPGVISAIYRRATIWIDAAPRPRSAAGLLRAVACGALPVLAVESPLTRIAGPGVLTFPLTSFAACAQTLAQAMALNDRDERVAMLATRLGARGDLALTFGELMAAYARAATAV